MEHYLDATVLTALDGQVLSARGHAGFAPAVDENWWLAIAPADSARLQEICRRVVKSGAAECVRFTRAEPNGTARLIEAVLCRSGEGLEWHCRDLTQQITMEENFALWDRALQAARTAFVISDARLPDCPLTYVNPAFEKMTGYHRTEVIGRNCRFLQGSDVQQAGLTELRRSLKEGRSCRVVLRNYTKAGAMFWNDFTLSPIFNNQGDLTHFVGVQSEITQQKLLEAQLSHAAFHDGLTDLPNRLLFHDRVASALQELVTGRGKNFAVLLLDLDRFKSVNDTMGHLAGDEYLRTIAQRVTSCVRDGDTFARLGGDEFALLANSLNDIEHAEHLAARIMRSLDEPVVIGGHPLRASLSLGMTLATADHSRVDELLREADTALYQAKRLGGGRSIAYDPQMQRDVVARLQLEAELRRALERGGEFWLMYQPIVSLATGSVTKFEALIRWNHPERGQLSPADFIAVAEDSGLIVPIGRWVQREVCARLKEWLTLTDCPDLLTVSINVAAKELEQPDFITCLAETLRQSQVPARHLRLELTEGALMERPERTRNKLAQLRKMGFHLKIDNFGTGHSSLSRLQDFPVDSLKIDKSFVDHIESDKTSLEIARSIAAMAHMVGLVVVAEGIETAGQAEILRQFGCEYGQGYHFARPQDAEAVKVLLSRPVINGERQPAFAGSPAHPDS